MSRKLRLEYPGAIYHVMSRANGQGNLFESDVDRQDFVKTLAETCAKTGFQVHACWSKWRANWGITIRAS